MSEQPGILFVSRKWPPAMGGMETYSKALSDALRAHGDVETIVLPGQADGSVPGAGKLLWFGVTAALALLFRRRPPTVTHVADMASWPLALCARIRNLGGRQVLSAHGTDVSYPLRGGIKGRVYGAYLRLGAILLGPVTVLANSAATAEATRQFGYRDIVVIPLAAEVAADGAGERRRSLLFSGRLVTRKGCAWFVRNVMPLLPDDLTLDVAGTVWDDTEAKALDDPRVRYLGRLDQADVFRAYTEALCVVVPNIEMPNGEFEGFGLVALEAAAVGGVVLASRHDGLKEAVIDGVTGFHLPPGDAPAWAEKIREISGWDDDERVRFTRNAKQVCAEKFTWGRVAADTFAAYRVAE